MTGIIVGLLGMLTGLEGTAIGSDACLIVSVGRTADFCESDAAPSLNEANEEPLGSCDGALRGLEISEPMAAAVGFVGEAFFLHLVSAPFVVAF